VKEEKQTETVSECVMRSMNSEKDEVDNGETRQCSDGTIGDKAVRRGTRGGGGKVWTATLPVDVTCLPLVGSGRAGWMGSDRVTGLNVTRPCLSQIQKVGMNCSG